MNNNTVFGISNGSFPYGTATSLRNITFLQGLAELNYNCKLISLYPDKNQDPRSNEPRGSYNGVEFEYGLKNLKYCKAYIFRQLLIFLSIARIVNYINKNQKCAVILFITHPLYLTLFLLLLNRKNKILLHEVTEYPFIRKNYNKKFDQLYNNYVLKKIDKLFVINQSLKNYFSTYIKENKIQVINMFIDPTPYYNDYLSPFNFEYIAYCGRMNTDKDGVHLLIEAFDTVNRYFPDIKLVLIGDTVKRPLHSAIQHSLTKCNNRKNIIFTGYINNAEMPSYLKNAKLLALCRPANMQAEGGFPTKLGEYLATGKPTVVTSVGEIPLFIKHKKNGFLSKPDAKAFAETIIEVLNNYNDALQIAEKGTLLVNDQFNYLENVKKMAHFIQ